MSAKPKASLGMRLFCMGLAIVMVIPLGTNYFNDDNILASSVKEIAFAGGSGTIGDPYIIENVWELQNMSVNVSAHYVLGNDIDASITVDWNVGAGFKAVGTDLKPFTGSLDGCNHTITGLYINRPSLPYSAGLFGTVGTGGKLKKVGLVDADVTGSSMVGGLIGHNNGGTVNNSYVIGNVKGGYYTGGLVGHNKWDTISNSYATGSVSGSGEYVGGLVGRNWAATITNSYATGSVTGTDDRVGGLVGDCGYSTISDSYATGNVIGGLSVGGLVGYLDHGTVTTSYATGNASGISSSTGGLVGGSSGCTVAASYATGHVHGGASVGGLVGNFLDGAITDSYSTGSVSGTGSVGGLVGYCTGIVFNSHYNIDVVPINYGTYISIGGLYAQQYQSWFSNNFSLDIAEYSETLVPSGEYYEISSAQSLRDLLGFEQNPGCKFRLTTDMDLSSEPGLWIPYFAGAEFDGGNHTIDNLLLNMPFISNLGMFGINREGELNNIGLVNNNVFGFDDVGGLVACSVGTISNSYATGTASGRYRVGGLAGTSSGMVTDSYATGTVSGNWFVGGLIGTSGGTVNKSYATGSVSNTGYYTGGLVGSNHATITASYAAGTASGTKYVGGLAGQNNARITDSYANGPAIGGDYVGGFIGQNSGPIFRTHATGTVRGNLYIGGLVGKNMGNITCSDAIGNTNGTEYIGGLVGLNDEGNVTTSYSTGNVMGNSFNGGLMGYTRFGMVNCSFAIGDVSGNTESGGFLGINDWGMVTDSYARGNVTRLSGTDTVFGGFVGCDWRGKVMNCYSTGRVVYEGTSNPTDKGFAGSVDTNGYYEMTGNFWDVETSLQTSSAGNATGQTTAVMKTQSTFTKVNWDFLNIWHMRGGVTYPLLWWQNPPLESYTIELQAGWNLISIPMELVDTSVDSVLSSISGKWDVVKYYDTTDRADPWKTYRVWGTNNDLTGLNHRMGFWLHTMEACILTVNGTVPQSTSINLYAGWNLVGYPTQTEETVGNALWGTGADRVEVFDAASPYVKEAEPTYIMKPGEGYWVHVPVDSVWTVEW